MSALNPYELLGVTIHSSLAELRKAYCRLALIMHPDKGGDPKDMDILKNSYEYVKEQLELNKVNDLQITDFEEPMLNVEVKASELQTVTSDELIAELVDFTFETFQKENASDKFYYNIILRELYKEYLANNEIIPSEERKKVIIKQFLIDKADSLFPSSIEHGYGSDINSTVETVQHFGKQDIVEYKEPKSFFETKVNQQMSTTSLPTKLDDYTTQSKGLCLTDYHQAFKDITLNNDAIDSLFDDNVKDSFEILCQSRGLNFSTNKQVSDE